MPKRISSKTANHINPGLLRTQSSGNSQLDANTIEEMAKIFMQTQTNMVNNPNSQANKSQEVLVLLQQINDKLESLQGSLATNDNTLNSSQEDTQQSEKNQATQQQQNNQVSTGTANESDVSQELRKLFSTLLTNDKQANSVSNGQKAQSTSNFRQQQGQRTMQNNNNSSIAVQTAAQVLSQAQYELSNELEASLQSLKQVISESEKIANKISSLLGEENQQKQ